MLAKVYGACEVSTFVLNLKCTRTGSTYQIHLLIFVNVARCSGHVHALHRLTNGDQGTADLITFNLSMGNVSYNFSFKGFSLRSLRFNVCRVLA